MRASSFEPGQPGWLGFRDLASLHFPLYKNSMCSNENGRASPDTEISVFASPVTGMKLERSRLVHLGNRAEISHMNSNRAEISAL